MHATESLQHSGVCSSNLSQFQISADRKALSGGRLLAEKN